jgi:hypothetical protein
LLGDRNKERIGTFADRAKPYELFAFADVAYAVGGFAVICAKEIPPKQRLYAAAFGDAPNLISTYRLRAPTLRKML